MPGPDTPDDTTATDLGRPGGRPRSVVLRAIVAIAWLEAAAMVVFAAAVLVEVFRGGSTNIGVSVFLTVFFAGLAWMLVASGLALWRGRRGGRAPVAGWQVFQVLIGVTLLSSGTPWAVAAGLVLLLTAVGVLVGLMTRPVVEDTAG